MVSPTRRYIKATIPVTPAVLSDEIDLQDEVLVGFQVLTDWTAANITFLASFDGTTFAALYDQEGNAAQVLSANVAADRPVSFSSSMVPLFAGVRKLKLQVSVAQAEARTVFLV